MKIVFTNVFPNHLMDYPKPAQKLVPEWYKLTESYLAGEKKPDGKGETTGTIKKCIPVFDAISAGYIIELPVDVYVSNENGEPYYQWSDLSIINFHPIEQAPLHPQNNGSAYPKFTNPWSIRTPKGYSVLFVQPFHRESIFTILPGIVDCDNYFAPVNFPFVLNDKNFEGLIPKGTPIAQVIPFKRDSWQMKLGDESDLQAQNKITNKLRSRFFDRYKSMFWSKKEYR